MSFFSSCLPQVHEPKVKVDLTKYLDNQGFWYVPFHHHNSHNPSHIPRPSPTQLQNWLLVVRFLYCKSPVAGRGPWNEANAISFPPFFGKWYNMCISESQGLCSVCCLQYVHRKRQMLYKASLGTRPLHAEEEEGLVPRPHKALLVNCRLPIPWTWGILLMTRDVCYCLTRTLCWFSVQL